MHKLILTDTVKFLILVLITSATLMAVIIGYRVFLGRMDDMDRVVSAYLVSSAPTPSVEEASPSPTLKKVKPTAKPEPEPTVEE